MDDTRRLPTFILIHDTTHAVRLEIATGNIFVDNRLHGTLKKEVLTIYAPDNSRLKYITTYHSILKYCLPAVVTAKIGTRWYSASLPYILRMGTRTYSNTALKLEYKLMRKSYAKPTRNTKLPKPPKY